MKPFTKKKRQWAWFIGLWCGGLSAVLLMSYIIKWMMRIA
jgi:uncharacterized membrane protein